MSDCVALFRGINVGRAKRIAMADLKSVFEAAGYTHVRTLLNSGNVVFNAPRALTGKHAALLQAAVEVRCGVTAAVVILSAAEFRAIVAGNPMLGSATDNTRHLVAFAATPAVLGAAADLDALDWGAERVRFGGRAAYLWCPAGILDSPLLKAFSRRLKHGVTTRNWATVLKLESMLIAP